MSKQAQNTLTVDYTPATSVSEVKVALSKALKGYATMTKAHDRQEESRTAVAALAIRDAEDLGYLVDGRNRSAAERATDTVTKSDLASTYGVTGGMVTFWIRLAGALRAGVVPGDAVWTALVCKPGRAARIAAVGAACIAARTPGDITKAMQAEGLDPVTGKRIPKPKDGRPDKGSDSSSEETDTRTPDRVALDALKVLDQALKDLPADSDQWLPIRTEVVRIMRRENTLRGTTGATPAPAKRTASKRSARKAG